MPQEQEKINERRKRLAEENGDQVTEVRNSDNGIENLVVETADINEEKKRLLELRAVSGGGRGKGPYDSIRPKDFGEYVMETIREIDNTPWYKRAWSHVKAFFTGRSYEEVILREKDNKINKRLVDTIAEYERLRDEYQDEARDFKTATQTITDLNKRYERLESKTKKDDPILGVQKNEVEREIQYQTELADASRERIESHYEPALQRLGDEIFALKKAKISIDNALKGVQSIRKAYALQKCSV
jgi:hypothetical protein